MWHVIKVFGQRKKMRDWKKNSRKVIPKLNSTGINYNIFITEIPNR